MAAKKKSTSAKARPSERFPVPVAARVPPSLAKAFDDVLPAHEGRFVFALPFRGASDKRVVRFDPHGAWDLMSSYGDSLPQTAAYVPLATAGKADDNECFAVDPSSAELPVHFFEHEAGYHPFAPSLDAFLGALLKKGERTPFEKLEALVEKASALQEKEKNDAVVALLAPAVEALPRVAYGDDAADDVGRAFNILGLAYRATKDAERATRAFERARAVGNDDATLNLASLFEDEKDFARCAAIAEELRAVAIRGRDPYEWFWSRNYAGRAHARLGHTARAVRAFHEVDVELRRAHPKYIAEARTSLDALVAEGGAPGELAASILSWFGRTTTPTPEEAARLRAFWSALPPKVRAKLAADKKLGEAPTDEALLDLTRATSIDLEGTGVADLAFLAAFVRLDHLDAKKNALESLATLPALPKLAFLSLNEGKLTSLEGIERAPNLEYLYARKNQLTSLAGLERLGNLRELDVSGNKVSDLGPVGELAALRKLDMRDTAVVDLGPLSGCRDLEEIDLVGSSKVQRGLAALTRSAELREISGVSWKVPRAEAEAFVAARPDVDLSVEGMKRYAKHETTDDDRAWWKRLASNVPLREAIWKDRADADEPIDEQLGKLRHEDHFSLASEGISSIAELAACASVRFLDIARNPVADLAPLADQVAMTHLRASATKVTSVASLRKLTRLFELRLGGAPLASLDGLEACRALEILELDDTAVTSLAPLAGVAALRRCTFSGAPVADLAPLASHVGLGRVDCSASRVTDLTPLAACTGLTRVDCWGLPGVSGLLALAALPQLNAVYSRGAFGSAELAAFRTARPDVDVD